MVDKIDKDDPDQVNYCVSLETHEGVKLIFIFPMDKKEIEMIEAHNHIAWVFGDCIRVEFFKNSLAEFSILPAQ